MIVTAHAAHVSGSSGPMYRYAYGACRGSCRSPFLSPLRLARSRTGAETGRSRRTVIQNTRWVMGLFAARHDPPGSGRGPLGWAPSTLEPIGADLSALFPLSKTLLSGTARRGTSSPGLDSRPRLCTGTVGRLALGRTRALLSHLKTETVARLCTSGTVGRLGRARALLSHPSNRVVGVAARVARVVPQLAAALAERGAVANEVARQVHVRCRWCVRVRRPPRPQCLLHGGTADAVADKGLGR